MGRGKVIVLDTCVLIFDAIAKEKLSLSAKKAISSGEEKKQLFCCDISVWEIAMLIQKKRLNVIIGIQDFLNLILKARQIDVLDITPDIAELSVTHPSFLHYDPADRIIAATTIHHNAKLVTCDQQLANLDGLEVIW